MNAPTNSPQHPAQKSSVENASAFPAEPAPSPLVPPVQPVYGSVAAPNYEVGVLFSDPDLTAWWWNMHSFLSNSERLAIATKAVGQCTSAECHGMFQSIREDLERHLAPVDTVEAMRTGIRNFARARPYFSIAVVLALAYFCIVAGMNIFSMVARVLH